MLTDVLKNNQKDFYKVVDFDGMKDRLLQLNFTSANEILTYAITQETTAFTLFIKDQLAKAGAKFGIGGYNENRTIYTRSNFFDTQQDEPRSLHLGIDIWGKAGTKVFAPLEGLVHSFAFNNNFGDYGATIILQHQLDAYIFHTLHGHLSLKDIEAIKAGDKINAGKAFASFGESSENGDWPPHLHFQIIEDMENKKGDYPGVCRFSERKKYLQNCPDPNLILMMMQYAECN